MKLWRTFLSYLQKMVFHSSFWAAVLVTCALCFTATGYVQESNSYAIGELLLRIPRDQLVTSPEFCSLSQFLNGMGTYSLMFAPLVASFPSVPLFCRERSSGSVRLLVPRCGINSWLGGFQLAAMVTGGLVVFGGYALFGLLCLVLFPSPAACGAEALVPLLRDSVGQNLAGAFLLGMCSVILSVWLCGLSKNACTILCGSFAFLYALSTLCARLPWSLSSPFITQVLTAADPTAPFSLLRYSAPDVPPVLLFQALSICLGFLLLRLLLGRRLDLGQ